MERLLDLPRTSKPPFSPTMLHNVEVKVHRPRRIATLAFCSVCLQTTLLTAKMLSKHRLVYSSASTPLSGWYVWRHLFRWSCLPHQRHIYLVKRWGALPELPRIAFEKLDHVQDSLSIEFRTMQQSSHVSALPEFWRSFATISNTLVLLRLC
jgi:hypothetical protein